MTLKTLLAAALAASFAAAVVLPITAHGAAAASKKKTTSITVKKWRGYGFLPGYPRSERERQRDKLMSEPRFYTVYGGGYLGGGFYSPGYVSGPSYGFGPPGFVRGQWNGGSIGPCYTQTPIGFIWNCGM